MFLVSSTNPFHVWVCVRIIANKRGGESYSYRNVNLVEPLFIECREILWRKREREKEKEKEVIGMKRGMATFADFLYNKHYGGEFFEGRIFLRQ